MKILQVILLRQDINRGLKLRSLLKILLRALVCWMSVVLMENILALIKILWRYAYKNLSIFYYTQYFKGCSSVAETVFFYRLEMI